MEDEEEYICCCGHSDYEHDMVGDGCHPCSKCECDCFFPDMWD